MAWSKVERNEWQYEYNKKHLKRIPLDVQQAYFALIKLAAEESGETINGFIKKAIAMRIGVEEKDVKDDENTLANTSV